ncbi:MAG TPA: ABC transporter permease [Vicinamibacterales bacterium]|nr:ABC transporter permease [Vicinamibacterales bacterium]
MNELRQILRTLLRHPAFSAVVILTLALGIGANTAIFTVVNSVLLRPFPFPDADRLVMIVERAGSTPTVTTSWENYQDWRDQSRAYEGFGAVRSLTMTLEGGVEPERLPAKMMSASMLGALRVAPTLGRAFSVDDDRPGAAGVALLSDAIWNRRFGGSRDALGRSITVDGQSYTIVGVMPPRFQLLAQADLLLPIGPWAATLPDDRNWHPGLFPIARLKPDVTVQQAQAEMDVISGRLEQQYPVFNHGVSARVVPLHEYAVENVRQSLVVLAAAVGFVLLIACANVANLLLARAVGREKEMAVKTALGASRRQIVRQLLTESVVLAVLGGASGLLIAVVMVPLLASLARSAAPGAGPIAMDVSTLAFTITVSIVTGLVFGMAPAFQTRRIEVSSWMNQAGERGNAAGVGHHRLRALLVVGEMAAATVLLVGAVLLAKSLTRLQDVPTGFSPGGLLVADAPLSPNAYGSQDKRNQLVDRLRDRLRALPGVRMAEVATAPPFSGAGSSYHFNIAGHPPRDPSEFVITGYRAVSDGYFSAFGIPLLAGRPFTDRDRNNSQPVAIVNDTFVRRFLGGRRELALSSRAQIGALPNDQAPLMDIVGIVGDTKQAFEADIQPTMFVPYLQYPLDLLDGMYRNLTIVLETAGSPEGLAGGLRATVHEIDPNQPLTRMRTMEEAMSESLSQPRLRAVLLTLFSTVALTLSLIGVYGVMAYVVSERTHELGVRIALGATPHDIRGLVLGQGARLAGIGIVTGIVLALVASRALQALLFGVSSTDPLTFAVAASALAITAIAAVSGPAYRASRIDPVVLLRS